MYTLENYFEETCKSYEFKDGRYYVDEFESYHNKILPADIGLLSVSGNFDAYCNFTGVVDISGCDFTGLFVCGDLNLADCKIPELPESFSEIYVGGDVHLELNKLTKLPVNFFKN